MPKIADWGPIEKEYRETRTSVSTLARAHGVSHATVASHMNKHGIVRNPPSALEVVDSKPKANELTIKEMKQLRDSVLSTHRAAVSLDHKRLDMISERLDSTTGLSNMQRLSALKVIVSIRETIIKLERQAHNIVEEAPPAPPPVAIQVNVNLDPQDAYLKLIGRK